MKSKYSKNILTIGLSAVLLFSTTAFVNAENSVDYNSSLEEEIPTQMKPGAILKYHADTEPTITFDHDEIITSPSLAESSAKVKVSIHAEVFEEVMDKKGRANEDEFFESVAAEAEELPVIDLGFDLPDPEPGLVVIYGSDGRINRYYNENDLFNGVKLLDSIPDSTVPYPGRLDPGTYEFGNDQTITITNGAVTGEGRFTVFRAGVGGSGTVGSSGKTLEAGDIATKRQVDNPKHNTAINARATDTDIVKTVYKNDIGTLPDAVMDVYFWGWNYEMFGYEYSDTLSFPGRYYYTY